MATKTQSKAAVDSAATSIKADIDNVLPTGVNITDGRISFPTQWVIQLNAGTLATAQSWRDSILAALAAAGRTATTSQTLGRRGDDGTHAITIVTNLATYHITGF